MDLNNDDTNVNNDDTNFTADIYFTVRKFIYFILNAFISFYNSKKLGFQIGWNQ